MLFVDRATYLYTTEPATSAVVDIQDTVVDTDCSLKDLQYVNNIEKKAGIHVAVLHVAVKICT